MRSYTIVGLTSELVVSMMDKLSGNNIPSDSNDERLDNGDGETENDELYQLSTISCTFSLSAWCTQYTTSQFRGVSKCVEVT